MHIFNIFQQKMVLTHVLFVIFAIMQFIVASGFQEAQLSTSFPPFKVEFAHSDYYSMILIKQNPRNTSINTFSWQISKNRAHKVLINDSQVLQDTDSFFDKSVYQIKSLVAENNQIRITENETQSSSQIFSINQLTITAIQICSQESIVLTIFNKTMSTYGFWSYNFKQKSQPQVILDGYSFQPKETICSEDQFLLPIFNGSIIIYDLKSSAMTSTFGLDEPIFLHQDVISINSVLYYRITSLQLDFFENSSLLVLANQKKIQIWNIEEKIIVSNISLSGTVMDIIYCQQNIYAVVNHSDGSQKLYNYSQTLDLQSSEQIPTQMHYQLSCTIDKVLILHASFNNYYLKFPLTNKQPLLPLIQGGLNINRTINFIKSRKVKSSLSGASSVIPVVSMSPLKKTFKFLNNNIDLFFPYQYHSVKYTQIVIAFSEEMDILAELKIKPSFLSKIKTDQSLPQLELRNQKYVQQMKLPNDEKSKVYYAQSVKQIYLITIPLSLCIFFITYVIKKLFQRVKVKHKIFEAFYVSLFMSSRWWILLVAVIQTNLSYIVFFGFMQIRFGFSLTFQDKINLIIACTIIFICLIYSISFYPMLFAKEHKGITNQIPSDTKFNFRGFLLISIMNCLDCFTRSALHGILLDHALLALFTESIVMIIVCMLLKKFFRESLLYYMSIIIYILISIFDLHLYLYISNVENILYELCSFSLVVSIIGMSLIRNLTVIFLDFKEFIKDLCDKNKIHNAPEQNYKSKKVLKVEDIGDDYLSKRSQNFIRGLNTQKIQNIFNNIKDDISKDQDNQSIKSKLQSSQSRQRNIYNSKMRKIQDDT